MIIEKLGFSARLESIDQIPAVKHQLGDRNSFREHEQSREDLLKKVENLQAIVCELLLQNQILRMASSGRETTPKAAVKTPLGRLENSFDFSNL